MLIEVLLILGGIFLFFLSIWKNSKHDEERNFVKNRQNCAENKCQICKILSRFYMSFSTFTCFSPKGHQKWISQSFKDQKDWHWERISKQQAWKIALKLLHSLRATASFGKRRESLSSSGLSIFKRQAALELLCRKCIFAQFQRATAQQHYFCKLLLNWPTFFLSFRMCRQPEQRKMTILLLVKV